MANHNDSIGSGSPESNPAEQQEQLHQQHQLNNSVDSGIAVLDVDSPSLKLRHRLQQCQRILEVLRRDEVAYQLLRDRLSKISNKKSKKKEDTTLIEDQNHSCNVCCVDLDKGSAKNYVKCYTCEKIVCRSLKCADWRPKDAQWECQLCHNSKESLAHTSSWVAEQMSFNQHKFVYPMRARSEVYIPIQPNYDGQDFDSTMHFESVSQIGARNIMNTEERSKIRQYVEEIVAEMLGGSLDQIRVGQLSKSENYLHLFDKYHAKLSNLLINVENGLCARQLKRGVDLPAIVNGHNNSNNSHNNNNSSSNINSSSNNNEQNDDSSQARLRSLIETIIAETLRNSALSLNGGASSEICLDTHTQADLDALKQRHRTEYYFEPKIYQDLLATAVLNKIADTEGNGRRRSLISESTPDLSGHKNIIDENYNAEALSTTSGSSIEPRSDCSLTDNELLINAGKTDSPLSLQAALEHESVLSDYIAAHMVPLPDFSASVTESEDDIGSVTSSMMADGTWEDNWLFKKKQRSSLQSSATPSSIGMLVPAPREHVRAQIGDRTADEVSDLSEMGSDVEETSLDINDRLLNKHLIGGQNTKLVLDELIDRTSLTSNTLPEEHEPPFTETTNTIILQSQASPCEFTEAPPQPPPPPPIIFQDGTQNEEPILIADQNEIDTDEFADALDEGCTGFSTVEYTEEKSPSVIEILAAMALGPMLAVPASEQQGVITPTEMHSLKELSDLALAEINSRSVELEHHSLDVIEEETMDLNLQSVLGAIAEPNSSKIETISINLETLDIQQPDKIYYNIASQEKQTAHPEENIVFEPPNPSSEEPFLNPETELPDSAKIISESVSTADETEVVTKKQPEYLEGGIATSGKYPEKEIASSSPSIGFCLADPEAVTKTVAVHPLQTSETISENALPSLNPESELPEPAEADSKSISAPESLLEAVPEIIPTFLNPELPEQEKKCHSEFVPAKQTEHPDGEMVSIPPAFPYTVPETVAKTEAVDLLQTSETIPEIGTRSLNPESELSKPAEIGSESKLTAQQTEYPHDVIQDKQTNQLESKIAASVQIISEITPLSLNPESDLLEQEKGWLSEFVPEKQTEHLQIEIVSNPKTETILGIPPPFLNPESELAEPAETISDSPEVVLQKLTEQLESKHAATAESIPEIAPNSLNPELAILEQGEMVSNPPEPASSHSDPEPVTKTEVVYPLQTSETVSEIALPSLNPNSKLQEFVQADLESISIPQKTECPLEVVPQQQTDHLESGIAATAETISEVAPLSLNLESALQEQEIEIPSDFVPEKQAEHPEAEIVSNPPDSEPVMTTEVLHLLQTAETILGIPPPSLNPGSELPEPTKTVSESILTPRETQCSPEVVLHKLTQQFENKNAASAETIPEIALNSLNPELAISQQGEMVSNPPEPASSHSNPEPTAKTEALHPLQTSETISEIALPSLNPEPELLEPAEANSVSISAPEKPESLLEAIPEITPLSLNSESELPEQEKGIPSEIVPVKQIENPEGEVVSIPPDSPHTNPEPATKTEAVDPLQISKTVSEVALPSLNLASEQMEPEEAECRLEEVPQQQTENLESPIDAPAETISEIAPPLLNLELKLPEQEKGIPSDFVPEKQAEHPEAEMVSNPPDSEAVIKTEVFHLLQTVETVSESVLAPRETQCPPEVVLHKLIELSNSPETGSESTSTAQQTEFLPEVVPEKQTEQLESEIAASLQIIPAITSPSSNPEPQLPEQENGCLSESVQEKQTEHPEGEIVSIAPASAHTDPESITKTQDVDPLQTSETISESAVPPLNPEAKLPEPAETDSESLSTLQNIECPLEVVPQQQTKHLGSAVAASAETILDAIPQTEHLEREMVSIPATSLHTDPEPVMETEAEYPLQTSETIPEIPFPSLNPVSVIPEPTETVSESVLTSQKIECLPEVVPVKQTEKLESEIASSPEPLPEISPPTLNSESQLSEQEKGCLLEFVPEKQDKGGVVSIPAESAFSHTEPESITEPSNSPEMGMEPILPAPQTECLSEDVSDKQTEQLECKNTTSVQIIPQITPLPSNPEPELPKQEKGCLTEFVPENRIEHRDGEMVSILPEEPVVTVSESVLTPRERQCSPEDVLHKQTDQLECKNAGSAETILEMASNSSNPALATSEHATQTLIIVPLPQKVLEHKELIVEPTKPLTQSGETVLKLHNALLEDQSAPTVILSKSQSAQESETMFMPTDPAGCDSSALGKTQQKCLRRQLNTLDKTPSETDEDSAEIAKPDSLNLLGTICKFVIKDKRLLATIERRRCRSLIMHKYLSSFDSMDDTIDENFPVNEATPNLYEESTLNFNSSRESIDKARCMNGSNESNQNSVGGFPDSENDYGNEFLILSSLRDITFNFINDILFSDQISTDSNRSDESAPSTAYETFNGDDSEQESVEITDEYEGETISRTLPPENQITNTTNSTNTITNLSITSLTNRRNNGKLTNGSLRWSNKLETKSELESGHNQHRNIDIELNEDDIDDVVLLRRFVPGSIAEREVKKWYNAVEMPNNPYAPEALKQRISGTQERCMDVPNISPSAEQKALALMANADDAGQQLNNQQTDYKRYSRDYYINNNNNNNNNNNGPTVVTAGMANEKIDGQQGAAPGPGPEDVDIVINEAQNASKTAAEQHHQETKQPQQQDQQEVYKALPVQVLEDGSSFSPSLAIDTQSNPSLATTTTSEDSDTVRIYDFNRQETTVLKQEAKPDQSIETLESSTSSSYSIDSSVVAKKRERPVVLQFGPGDSAPTIGSPIGTPTRGSTPPAFRFLQPKRRLIEPSQVLSMDLDDSDGAREPSTPVTEKAAIEDEVVHAMPSVKALAQAFLLTSKHIQPERRWRARAKHVRIAASASAPETPDKPAVTTSNVSRKHRLEHAVSMAEVADESTIASDLSSLETDSSIPSDAGNAIPPLPASPVPVRRGFLRSNIAFFENLKFK